MLKTLLKTTLLFSTAFLLQLFAKAQSIISLYDQLVYVNNNWKTQKDANPSLRKLAAYPLTEQEIVKQHLQQTELLLRSRKPTNLTAQQLVNRFKNLDVLHNYWQAGIFPKNTHHINRQSYFIDDYHNYCAVGFLMKESGADAMARSIHESQNYSYLADIKHPDLNKWAENSGLSLDELALIQPSYGNEWTSAITEIHYSNVGQDINEHIEIHQSNGAQYPYFTSVLFFDYAGNLYKRLPIVQMQSLVSSSQFYYYQFLSNESFADSGRIVLYRDNNGAPYSDTVSVFIYNSQGITLKDYDMFSNSVTTTRHFNVIETADNPVGNSLTMCGTYRDAWNPTILPATVGTVNPCTIGALPITLLSFDCQLQKNTVLVKWQTASETNNSYFEVQKSTNGVDFTTIGKVAGAGNSSGVRSYSFVDGKPDYVNHYRLKQTDRDGGFSYSAIELVKFATNGTLDILQNPASGILKFRINSSEPNAGKVAIYDFSGRTIKEAIAKAGFNELPISNLAKGKYMLRLFSKNGSVYTQPFIIQ